MLKAYHVENGELRESEGELDRNSLAKALWVDLCGAKDKEKRLVEETFDIDVDPVNDYEPFQVSTHYRADDNQATMTGLVLMLREDDQPHLLKVTFIRAADVIVTVSEGEDGSMSALVDECEAGFPHKPGRDDVFAALLEMVIDHSDNTLDKVGHDLDGINTRVFQHHTAQRRRGLRDSPRKRNRQLEAMLTDIGPSREILVKLRRSVLSFVRMLAFLREQKMPKSLLDKLESFERDLKSIAEAESDLSTTAGFLLDGIVGYIGLLQNKVMNVLTFVATVLTPPMVIAGIYGMNFKFMPELQWTYGYPFALALCVASSAAVLVWMRARGM